MLSYCTLKDMYLLASLTSVALVILTTLGEDDEEPHKYGCEISIEHQTMTDIVVTSTLGSLHDHLSIIEHVKGKYKETEIQFNVIQHRRPQKEIGNASNHHQRYYCPEKAAQIEVLTTG